MLEIFICGNKPIVLVWNHINCLREINTPSICTIGWENDNFAQFIKFKWGKCHCPLSWCGSPDQCRFAFRFSFPSVSMSNAIREFIYFSFSIYRECNVILNSRTWSENEKSCKEHFESGVRLGIGAFNLVRTNSVTNDRNTETIKSDWR